MTDTRAPTHTERLASDIADAILAGTLTPGSRLDEASLATRYGVSRTPVREALRQLATTGLIDMRPRRGAVVTHVTSRQLEQLFVAMGEIEATCARLSAISMTPIERRRLESHHETMRRLAEQEDEGLYSEANVVFHTAIYEGAHNDVLLEIATGLRRRLAPFRRAQFRAPGRVHLSHAEHDHVVQAILRADAGDAHATMLQHVSLVEETFEQMSRKR